MMIQTPPRSQTVDLTQNLILMWICGWRMMWMRRTALIYTAMWIWKGTVKMKWRKMNRRKMRRRRRRIMAKNLGRLARERW
jgi:hypothetical protein